MHVDYGLTLLLGLALLVKYVFVDRHTDVREMSHTLQLCNSFSQSQAATQTDLCAQGKQGDNSFTAS